jgi:hypothetical protein
VASAGKLSRRGQDAISVIAGKQHGAQQVGRANLAGGQTPAHPHSIRDASRYPPARRIDPVGIQADQPGWIGAAPQKSSTLA